MRKFSILVALELSEIRGWLRFTNCFARVLRNLVNRWFGNKGNWRGAIPCFHIYFPSTGETSFLSDPKKGSHTYAGRKRWRGVINLPVWHFGWLRGRACQQPGHNIPLKPDAEKTINTKLINNYCVPISLPLSPALASHVAVKKGNSVGATDPSLLETPIHRAVVLPGDGKRVELRSEHRSHSASVLYEEDPFPRPSRAGRKIEARIVWLDGKSRSAAAVPLLLWHLFVRRWKRTVDLALLFQTDRFYWSICRAPPRRTSEGDRGWAASIEGKRGGQNGGTERPIKLTNANTSHLRSGVLPRLRNPPFSRSPLADGKYVATPLSSTGIGNKRVTEPNS